MSERDIDCIVVGAGLSGLSAAYKLKQRQPDLKVLVLEANNRIGGRLESIAVPIPSQSGKKDILDLGYISTQT